MTKEERKEYKKEYSKKYYEKNKSELLIKMKEYNNTNKKRLSELAKVSYKKRKEENRAWNQIHKDEIKKYHQIHKEELNEYAKKYMKNDVNSFGESKNSIRFKSRYILKKSGIKIPDYEIHHCFTYDDPSKFIYCSKELHLKIHQFLRDNHIDADSDHYEQIKHLLDEKVVTFGL